MKFTRHLLIPLLTISLLAPATISQKAVPSASKSVVMTALQEELQRAQKILKQKGDPPPYLISYQVTDMQQIAIAAQYGALQNNDKGRVRLLDVDVRVGDYQLDNTHRTSGGGGGYGGGGAMPISSEDDLDAIKSSLWMVTDQKYKSAQERLIQIKANQAVKVEEEDKSADLSRETPQIAVTPTPSLGKVDQAAWEKNLKDWSALFNKYPEILSSNVTFNADADHEVPGQLRRHSHSARQHARAVSDLRAHQSGRWDGVISLRSI